MCILFYYMSFIFLMSVKSIFFPLFIFYNLSFSLMKRSSLTETGRDLLHNKESDVPFVSYYFIRFRVYFIFLIFCLLFNFLSFNMFAQILIIRFEIQVFTQNTKYVYMSQQP